MSAVPEIKENKKIRKTMRKSENKTNTRTATFESSKVISTRIPI